MKFYFLTLFPEIIQTYLDESIIGRAHEKGLFDYEIINIRDFSKDKHKKVDDYPYGGGPGMLMTAQPIADAVRSVEGYEDKRVVYLSPTGKTFTQAEAGSIAKDGRDIIFICGHYEGIDQRVIDLFVDELYSVGDFVVTGGELPALLITDAVVRNIEGVLPKDSLENESFSQNLLEHPQYTRPEVFEGLKVPEILLSGHHQKIEDWKKETSLKRTETLRPDLLEESLGEENE